MLYTNFVVEGTLFKYLAEVDQFCNERMEITVNGIAKQDNVTEVFRCSELNHNIAEIYRINRRRHTVFLTS